MSAEPEPLHDPEAELPKMSFLDHLEELRGRLIKALIAVVVGFLVACAFIDRIFAFIMLPMKQMLQPGQKLIFIEPTEAFMLNIWIGLMAGLLIASPVVFSQVWLFIAPGLYSHEKKLAIPFIVMSSLFFITGAAFAHYYVFPLTFKFFGSFSSDAITFMPRIEPAFAIYLRLLIAFGIVFQMPTIVLFLSKMGVISARFMVRHIKYALLIIVIISAVVTPDGGGVSLVAMAGPMMLLYLLSIGLAWMFGKKRTEEISE